MFFSTTCFGWEPPRAVRLTKDPKPSVIYLDFSVNLQVKLCSFRSPRVFQSPAEARDILTIVYEELKLELKVNTEFNTLQFVRVGLTMTKLTNMYDTSPESYGLGAVYRLLLMSIALSNREYLVQSKNRSGFYDPSLQWRLSSLHVCNKWCMLFCENTRRCKKYRELCPVYLTFSM